MIKLNIELINKLLISLQSEISSIPNRFSSYELDSTEFSCIQDIRYVTKEVGEELLHYLPHHAICLITRKEANRRLFSCIYLVDVLRVKVVGFCRVTGSWHKVNPYIDNDGNVSIEVYTPGNGFYLTNIQVTYISGVYKLIER